MSLRADSEGSDSAESSGASDSDDGELHEEESDEEGFISVNNGDESRTRSIQATPDFPSRTRKRAPLDDRLCIWDMSSLPSL